MRHHKWNPTYPQTNTALDYCNRHMRRHWRQRLAAFLRRNSPRIVK